MILSSNEDLRSNNEVIVMKARTWRLAEAAILSRSFVKSAICSCLNSEIPIHNNIYIIIAVVRLNYVCIYIYIYIYIQSPLQDSRLFGPRPWKILATTYEQMGSWATQWWRILWWRPGVITLYNLIMCNIYIYIYIYICIYAEGGGLVALLHEVGGV